jgi:hypothetical protein
MTKETNYGKYTCFLVVVDYWWIDISNCGGIQMITITIDEYVNGFSVIGHDWKDGKFINEIHEEKIEVLKTIERWAACEIILELKRRNENASIM